MKTKIQLFLLISLTLSFASCRKENASDLKVALLAYGPFNDGDFNESALAGFNRAKAEYHFTAETTEYFTDLSIDSSLASYCDRGYDLIIGIGYYFSGPIKKAAPKFPDTDFLILDVNYDTIPGNVCCATYAIDQVSFPAGVLAAWLAQKSDPAGPVAGFVSGPDTSVMNRFARPYANGVAYFNGKFGKLVGCAGEYADNFADSLQGAALANDLITNQSVDVLYAFAGFTGTGALNAAHSKGIAGIGVDVDQYFSLPSIRSILLTSCMKRLDNTVFQVIGDFRSGHFAGGTHLENTLSNSGVSLAPYHDYEFVVPDSIKTLIASLMDDIKNGKQSTGWK